MVSINQFTHKNWHHFVVIGSKRGSVKEENTENELFKVDKIKFNK